MKPKLLVVGAGGHARSVLDIALQNAEYELVGVIDPLYGTQTHMTSMENIPIIGTDAMLPDFLRQGISHIFIAIGENGLRKKLYEKAVAMGFHCINLVSQYAVLSKSVKLGHGVCVMAGAVLNVNTVIGDNSIINTNCSIDHDCTVGNHCHIAPGVAVSGTVSIGDSVQIGTGACVIDGIQIEENSFIGAGAAVVTRIPANVLAVGVPAKVIKKRK